VSQSSRKGGRGESGIGRFVEGMLTFSQSPFVFQGASGQVTWWRATPVKTEEKWNFNYYTCAWFIT